jgi:hypothetical protein
MSDSEHIALGQGLGYVYQFYRATYRLLEADSSVVSVAVEHVDDVSVHRADGSSIREQDKATIGAGRVLTDRSVALWKTIAIWAEAVLADPGVLRSTEFHLVTNGEVDSNGLAARIHAAKTASGMDSVATEILIMADALRDDLQPFATKIRDMPSILLAALVGQIFMFDNVAASFGGRLEDLQSLRLLGELQRLAIFDNAVGWVRRTVLAAALDGKPTLIDRTAFNREVRALFRRVSVAPLAVVFETPASALDPANYRSHGFLQQLDWIDTEPSFVRDCVIHYVQAQVARVKWADADAVSEASLRAYEEDLKMRWRLQVRRQSQRTYPSPVLQGQELLTETLSEDTVLDGQPMPKAITCGSFHVLANFDSRTNPEIGWHPEFQDMAKASRDGS